MAEEERTIAEVIQSIKKIEIEEAERYRKRIIEGVKRNIYIVRGLRKAAWDSSYEVLQGSGVMEEYKLEEETEAFCEMLKRRNKEIGAYYAGIEYPFSKIYKEMWKE